MIVHIDKILRSGQVKKERREQLKQQKAIMKTDLKTALKEIKKNEQTN